MTKKHLRKIPGKKGKPTGAAGAVPEESFLIWGINSVMEAVAAKPDCIIEVFLEKGRQGTRQERLEQTLRQQGVKATEVQSLSEIPGWSGKTRIAHEGLQGVAARISLPVRTFEGLLAKIQNSGSPPLLLALDSIQDPHNLGAIIRSAAAAGVDGLILPKDRSVPVTGTAVKVSAGSVFHLEIYRVTNLVRTLDKLKDSGVWIFGTAKDASASIYEADFTVPACLVIGSEGKGLRPLVADHCDMLVNIPMQGTLDSLNASVATGIALFEAVRQRMAGS